LGFLFALFERKSLKTSARLATNKKIQPEKHKASNLLDTSEA
jgi:hypothetical protein